MTRLLPWLPCTALLPWLPCTALPPWLPCTALLQVLRRAGAGILCGGCWHPSACLAGQRSGASGVPPPTINWPARTPCGFLSRRAHFNKLYEEEALQAARGRPSASQTQERHVFVDGSLRVAVDVFDDSASVLITSHEHAGGCPQSAHEHRRMPCGMRCCLLPSNSIPSSLLQHLLPQQLQLPSCTALLRPIADHAGMLQAHLIQALRDPSCTKRLCLPERVHQGFAVISKHNTPPTAHDLAGAHASALPLQELGACGSMQLCVLRCGQPMRYAACLGASSLEAPGQTEHEEGTMAQMVACGIFAGLPPRLCKPT